MNNELKTILKDSSLLLVENDEKIMEKFSRLLGLYVKNVYQATSGIEALEIYKKNKPSFIITDIEMPHMDGLEFLDILRKKNENVPAIITSAYSNKEYLLQSIKLQLIDYLIKPIDHNDLMLALERVAISLKKNSLQSVVEIYDGVFYRPIKKIVSVDGINNKLTAIESELLEFLILNKGSIVTKKMVEDKIYLFKEMSDVALKNIIYKLRKKLIKNVIVSVDRIGYKIN